MAVELDTPRAPQIPVAGTRDLGQVVVGMVCDKWIRERHDGDGNPIMNKRGAVAKEEVIVILIMDGTTGTIKVGSGIDAEESVPQPGDVSRLIFKGMDYGRLIDARRDGVGGGTQVGDVIRVEAKSATIWKGKGEIERQGVTDPAVIAKAVAAKLSVGMDREVRYRRAKPDEAELVTKAERVYHDRKAAITLDAPSSSAPADIDDAF